MQVKSSTSVSQKCSLNCFCCDVDDEKSFAADLLLLPSILPETLKFLENLPSLPIFVTQRTSVDDKVIP